MDLNFGKPFEGIKDMISHIIDNNPSLRTKMQACELSCGLESDQRFAVPDYAPDHALFVGDSHMIGNLIGSNAEIDSMFKKDPYSVQMSPKWNYRTGKFDMQVKKFVGDSDYLTPAQLLSPWNIGWFQGVFKKPLSYSRARDLVKAYTGTKPWAEAMSLLLSDYSGFAALTNAGRTDNMLSQDVGIKSGIMTSSVINMTVTYTLTTEEMQRARENGNDNPFAGVLVTDKQEYADYILDILTAYLIYFGNTSTGTVGLFNVNTAASWGGTSLSDIEADTNNTTKGSTAYRMFAKALRDFLTTVDNKFNYVKIAMSPLAYNLLATLVYSDVYNPDSAISIIKRNLETDMTKDGRKLKLDIISDPMLKNNTIFNANAYDYLVFVATEIEAGPGEKQQDVVLYGEPMKEFIYPTIPGSYHTSYKKLRKSAGIFCPVKEAVKVYYGFGKDS